LRTPFDLLATFLVSLIQWDISRRFLAAARRRLSRRAMGALHVGIVLFYVFIGVGFVLGVSSIVDRLRLPPAPSVTVGAIAQIWLFASSGAYVLLRGFQLLADRFWHAEFDPARRRLLNATGNALVVAPFAVIGYGMFVERLDFHVREVDIPVPGLADDLDGLRLVQLSDIHLSAFLSERDLARVVDSANELRPHLALVTGDLITDIGDPLDACLRQIARVRADAGILGCMGNHEEYAGIKRRTEREGARLGVRFLRSRAERLQFGNAALNVAGVDYQRVHERENYLIGAERLVGPGALNVLLSHNPDVFPVAVRKGFDVTISGHTHGGQITIEILDQTLNAARFYTPFVYGLYRNGPAAAYVTRGIGTIGIPARIGAPPEIALLRLRKV
jgi:predicted MPP superfamily phosphohydrolase